MSKTIVAQERKELSTEDIELIKKTVAKDASDTELKMFLHICKNYGLDPFLKEIVFMKRKVWNEYKGAYDEVPTMMVSRDGFLAIAHKSGSFDGMETNAIHSDAGDLMGAECTVWNKSCGHPIKQNVLFKEYCVYRRDNKTGTVKAQALWATKPETMIKKVAEAQALRKAFNIHGVYLQEEFDAELEIALKSDIEKITPQLGVSEKMNTSPVDHEKFVEEMQAKIMDEINACETPQAVSAVRRKYSTQIGLMLDKERAYIQERFDSQFQALVSGDPAETPAPAPKKSTKPVPKEPVDPHKELAEREVISKDFTKRAIDEISACKTVLEMEEWRKKNIDSIVRCLKDYSDYLKAYYATHWDKVKVNGMVKNNWK